jgi:hypothetical protein
VSRAFYDQYGEIEKTIPVETENGTIYRLITTKMDEEARVRSAQVAKMYQGTAQKSATSVVDCISSDRYIEKGNKGEADDDVFAQRGFVVDAVGVDIIGRAVADVIIRVRQILPEGDLEQTGTLIASGNDFQVEKFAEIPDNFALVGVAMENDGKDMDGITLYSRRIDWSTFKLTGSTRTDVDGTSSIDQQLTLVADAALTLDQRDRAFIRGVGAGTGEDVIASDFGSSDIEVIWGRYSLYDSQCLQNLSDNSGGDDGGGDDGGGSGGGSGGGGGGGGGGGFYEPIGL